MSARAEGGSQQCFSQVQCNILLISLTMGCRHRVLAKCVLRFHLFFCKSDSVGKMFLWKIKLFSDSWAGNLETLLLSCWGKRDSVELFLFFYVSLFTLFACQPHSSSVIRWWSIVLYLFLFLYMWCINICLCCFQGRVLGGEAMHENLDGTGICCQNH